jgi:hypothetical protein
VYFGNREVAELSGKGEGERTGDPLRDQSTEESFKCVNNKNLGNFPTVLWIK